jgi:hypothetical protein
LISNKIVKEIGVKVNVELKSKKWELPGKPGKLENPC